MIRRAVEIRWDRARRRIRWNRDLPGVSGAAFTSERGVEIESSFLRSARHEPQLENRGTREVILAQLVMGAGRIPLIFVNSHS